MLSRLCRSRELGELRAHLAEEKGSLEGLKKEVANTDDRASKQVLQEGRGRVWRLDACFSNCTSSAARLELVTSSLAQLTARTDLSVLYLLLSCSWQMKAAEVLREEVRAERERLVAREAVVAAAESHLETQKRDSDRQSAEIHNALQVCVGVQSEDGCDRCHSVDSTSSITLSAASHHVSCMSNPVWCLHSCIKGVCCPALPLHPARS